MPEEIAALAPETAPAEVVACRGVGAGGHHRRGGAIRTAGG